MVPHHTNCLYTFIGGSSVEAESGGIGKWRGEHETKTEGTSGQTHREDCKKKYISPTSKFWTHNREFTTWPKTQGDSNILLMLIVFFMP